MVTSAVFIALIGTLLFECAISASINYEPIKITINENFNSQPAQVFQELESLEPGVVQESANIYFKPQLNLPPSYIPPRIEDLISLIQQYHHSCTKDTSELVEKDKLLEILKPFMYRSSDIPKENHLGIVFKNRNNLQHIEPLKISASGLKNISTKSQAQPIKITEEPNEKESLILKEPTGVFSTIPKLSERLNSEPILNYDEPKPVISELENIPENPFSLNDIQEVKGENPILEPVIMELELKNVIPELGVIPEAPVLPPLLLKKIPSIVEEDVKKEKSIILKDRMSEFPTISEISVKPLQAPIINYVEPKSVTPELGGIPKAPVLPPLSLLNIPFTVEEGVKKNESIILEEPKSVFPKISEISVRPMQEPVINYVEPKPVIPELGLIPEAPVLPPLSLNDIHVVENEAKSENPILEPVIFEVKSKPVTPELGAIPEAPVLSPISLSNSPSIDEGDAKKEESIILEESTSVFPTISEISARPIQEPIIDYVQSKPVTPELGAIPEAPVLPPLSLSNMPSIVEEDVKKEESIIFAEPTRVFPTISEISARPIQEPIINYVQSKPVTPELGAIPEAAVLPPLSVSDMPSIVEEDVKKEESIILEEPTRVFPTISEISARPIQEPIINNVEPKLVTPELGAIPEAPVLPPLSLSNIDSFVEADVKKEESIILEEPTSVFPTISEISTRPLQEPIIDYVQSKPVTPELGAIPEAPVLPPLSLSNMPSTVEEDVKKVESMILEEPTSVFPTILEISTRPIQEPIINYGQFKPVTAKLGAIPEAPVLPPLSLSNMPSIVEEDVKKEVSIILEEPTGVFPTISEISTRPIQETIINYVEPKLVTPELGAIPEAPVLPPLSLSSMPSIVEEDVKKEESIILEEQTSVFSSVLEISTRPIQEPVIDYVHSKPVTPELGAIPEAPVLPPLSLSNMPSIVEEDVKKEESIILEEPTNGIPTISEISARPVQEPIINYVEPKPFFSELEGIPEPPVLLPFSLNDIYVVEQTVKGENPMFEPMTMEAESKPVIPELGAISKAPVLPSLSLNNISSDGGEDVEKEESIVLEEPMKVFSTIPELSVSPKQEPIINYVELEPLTPEIGAIPEAPVLPSLSLNNMASVVEEDVKKQESIILEEQTNVFSTIPEISMNPMQAPIVNYVELKPVISEFVAVPKGPVLPHFSLNDIHVIETPDNIEDREDYTYVFPKIPEITNRPIPVSGMFEIESKPATSGLIVIPDAPVLPPQPYIGIPPIFEEAKTEESLNVEECTYPATLKVSAILEPSVVSETAESFPLENKIFPVATEGKIEVLLEQSVEEFSPNTDTSSEMTLQEPKITNSYVLDEVSRPNSFSESVVTIRDTLPFAIFPKTSSNLGDFSYVPFISHFSNRAPNSKQLISPKPASLKRFLIKKHPFRLPEMLYPNLPPSISKYNKQFILPGSYAHEILEKRIAPNMPFKNNVPKRVKIIIRPNVLRGSS